MSEVGQWGVFLETRGRVNLRIIMSPLAVISRLRRSRLGAGLLRGALTLAAWMGALSPASRAADLDLAAYKVTAAAGPVEVLRRGLEEERVRLEFETQRGYLLALLRELKVPAASQLLVASKTSPNKQHISPRNPRALYFNDAVAVAFVPGAELIEIAAADPKLGVVFYTLDQRATARARLVRDDRCLECHASSKTLGAPGWLVRSFETRSDGEVDVLSGLMVTQRTPISDRWGGYYVTGDTGGQPHRGNQFSTVTKGGSTGNLTDLKALIDLPRFPEPTSDVVALMVLEHQVQMMNLLTRLRMETEALGERESFERVQGISEEALKYLLFLDEAPLAAPVRGNSSFARQFEAGGPADSQGRSLRELDLRTRLFKRPCSYMIYSPSFESLPQRAKRHVYRRLWEVLAGEDMSAPFNRLTPEVRAAVREILVQTKKDLPAYWRL
jgi:hypothetical protein